MRVRGQGKAKKDKTRQGKARKDKTRQDLASLQDKTRRQDLEKTSFGDRKKRGTSFGDQKKT